jgi:hypothetical protein
MTVPMMLAIEMIVSNEIAKRIEDSNSTLARLNLFKRLSDATRTVFVITFF